MGKKIREYPISIDIEADGPCPGINSMLQIGAVFYSPDGEVIHELGANLLEIPGAVADPETMKWWEEQEKKFPGIWARMMENRIEPFLAMERFQSAVAACNLKNNASPICVAYPAGYDFTWIYYYLCRFLGKSCVGFSCIDMKTLGMTLIQNTYHNSAKKRFPSDWFNPKLKHTHNALEDARGQGYTFWRMKEAMERSWSVLDASGNHVTAASDSQSAQ
jgi:hypothetical protein